MTEITLSHGDARATIALLGAEARQWRIAGRDLLWPGDPAIWSDISPILYPVVGWTRDGEERVDGVTYKLGLHGFARFETFAVESSGPDFARLALSDNARTRAVYPFAFALAIEYRLTDEALSIAIEVANPGHKRAPYACGLHPGFRWPFGAAGRAGALVQFAKNERPEVPELAPGGLVRATTRLIPLCGRNLPLSDALFEHDALCFLDCRSRSLAFLDASGASITMEYESFQHAALWTKPHAPFLCLEAWTGYSDPDGFDGDLFDKPGMRVLEPGERARHEARYVFRPE
ncbi:MAG: aldose 1-epimerase family protein [Roseiarcus sp.]